MGYPNVKEFFVDYLVTFDYENEHKEILTRVENEEAELQKGIFLNNPALVGHIAKNHEYINAFGYNWLCSGCPYRLRCDDMGHEAGEFVEQTRRATSIKQSTSPVKQL